jgi:hypothetical protein
MPMRRRTPPKPQKEPANRTLDWAAAATEARRQRDAEMNAVLTARRERGRQERDAWSPTHEISRTRKV